MERQEPVTTAYEVLYEGGRDGALIYQFDVLAALNAAYELRSGPPEALWELEVEYDSLQFEYGPFSLTPDADRPFSGPQFVVYTQSMSDEGLTEFRERLEEIRARRALVRRIRARMRPPK